MRALSVCAVLLALGAAARAKVYDRCELAAELSELLGQPLPAVATWVCLAYHESRYDTAAVGRLNGDGSNDHGILQISDLYWCGKNGPGGACYLPCTALRDDDLRDDMRCARRIYREHQRLSGDGYNAWAVYRAHCQGKNVKKYVVNCDGRERVPAELERESELVEDISELVVPDHLKTLLSVTNIPYSTVFDIDKLLPITTPRLTVIDDVYSQNSVVPEVTSEPKEVSTKFVTKTTVTFSTTKVDSSTSPSPTPTFTKEQSATKPRTTSSTLLARTTTIKPVVTVTHRPMETIKPYILKNKSEYQPSTETTITTGKISYTRKNILNTESKFKYSTPLYTTNKLSSNQFQPTGTFSPKPFQFTSKISTARPFSTPYYHKSYQTFAKIDKFSTTTPRNIYKTSFAPISTHLSTLKFTLKPFVKNSASSTTVASSVASSVASANRIGLPANKSVIINSIFHSPERPFTAFDPHGVFRYY